MERRRVGRREGREGRREGGRGGRGGRKEGRREGMKEGGRGGRKGKREGGRGGREATDCALLTLSQSLQQKFPRFRLRERRAVTAFLIIPVEPREAARPRTGPEGAAHLALLFIVKIKGD